MNYDFIGNITPNTKIYLEGPKEEIRFILTLLNTKGKEYEDIYDADIGDIEESKDILKDKLEELKTRWGK